MMRWKILNKRKTQNAKRKTEEIIKILLQNRGIKTKKEIEKFLNPKKPEDLTAKDVDISQGEIKKAITRIKKALKNGEKIIVYGDYDTDGVCGTAILWETLHQLGARVMPFIPKREEGYGLRVERITQMAKEGVKLIITVDNGVVSIKQVERAKKLGIEVIITDHHPPGERKPKALAIIHTTKLAGSGVAWFLTQKLLKIFPNRQAAAYKIGRFLDLVTIGTVTDVMPLVGPNRSIVKYGLDGVRQTHRVGLLDLYQFAGINKEKIGTYEIGYLIGPRLNAAGRIDDPIDSLRLVCTKDKEKAKDLAQKLDQKNRQRQELMEQTFIHARELWLREDGKSALIFVNHESYQEGIVGLVAGKLMEEFYRPAVIVAKGEEFSRASARSIEEFNIIEAIRSCADLLGSHGGHPQAAGFDVETTKIEILKNRLIEIAQNQLKEQELSPILEIDMELSLEDLSFELFKQLEKLEPYGRANPQPVFASGNVWVVDAQTVGNGSRHLKLRLASSISDLTLDAIGFDMGTLYSQLSPERSIDIAYNLLINEFNGQKRLQLKIKDIKINN
jgi:single-stranded-DNA-specific exonuclease